ncbi:tyrosine-protein phosphatase [Agromyces soli]
MPNTWDLGGLHGALGITQAGRVYRSATLDHLDSVERADLYDSGVRTIIDLRNADEVTTAIDAPFTRRHLPVEDQSDGEFMAKWGTLDSPAYYADVLERWPELIVAVFGALAAVDRAARSGAVLVHCAAGRDRTGMITAMLLQLCEVDRDAIVADYLAAVRAIDAHERVTSPGRVPTPTEFDALNERRSRELGQFLDRIDVPAYLTSNGLSVTEINRARALLLGNQ